jgi:hypothetical protein
VVDQTSVTSGTEVQPYVPVNPGDLISASLFNTVQEDVRKDIAAQIQQAVAEIKKDGVATADDAQKLNGKTLERIEQELLDKLLKELPGRTGYMRIFLRLETGKPQVISHGLKAMPLVDVYQLAYFEVICANGEEATDRIDTWVNFYLYHTGERTIRTLAMTAGQNQPKSVTVDIEPRDIQPSRVLFSDMLALYTVQYTDTTTLDDLETDFWTAFWRSPNNEFDADQYCHSPWFEKCCGEKRSVAELKQRGDWDDIWFKALPFREGIFVQLPTLLQTSTTTATKSINAGTELSGPGGHLLPLPFGPIKEISATAVLSVEHYDLDTLGVTLLPTPSYGTDSSFTHPPTELKVMLLLKV